MSAVKNLCVKYKYLTSKNVRGVCNSEDIILIYPTKKETHHYDFPIQISFKYENVNCHEIFISDRILLKVECGVDEYLYFPCVGTKHIKANDKGVLEALIQRYYLHEISSMFFISKV